MQTVAIVGAPYVQDRDKLMSALEAAFGERPGEVGLAGLAGPNDVVQWVTGVENWRIIGLSAAGWLGARMAENVAADVYSTLKNKLLKKTERMAIPPTTERFDVLLTQLVQIATELQSREADLQLRVSETPDQGMDPNYEPRGRIICLPKLAVVEQPEVEVALQILDLAGRAEDITPSMGGTQQYFTSPVGSLSRVFVTDQ